MDTIHTPVAPALTGEHALKTLIENRSVYSLAHFELNIFETHQQSNNVHLCFSDLVVTTMFRGKKIMHLPGQAPFEYLPGESVIVPGNKEMIIDFPEAGPDQPTQCLALAIDREKIRETIDVLNERYTKAEDGDHWRLDPDQLHLKNSQEIATTIDRLVSISKENNKAKDIFANLTLQELLIRLMQTQARHLIVGNSLRFVNSHRFAFVVNYIREHLHENITIQQLSRLACMSKPHFFRSFKQEFGLSPLEFIIRERLSLAKKYLGDPLLSISDAIYRSGFNNVNYFCQVFKKYEGMTPRTFKLGAAGLLPGRG